MNKTITSVCGGCEKATSSGLKCPKCLELDLGNVYFCSQDCFRENWKAHCVVHEEKEMKLILSKMTCGEETMRNGYDETNEETWKSDINLSRFIGFAKSPFTGALRPYPRPVSRSVPMEIKRPEYADSGVSKKEEADRRNPIKCYNQEEIECLRAAGRLGRQALDLAHAMCKVGVTGEDIDKAVHEFVVQQNAYPSPLNYYFFPKSCCVSVNEVICHGIPDLRPFKEGDIVNVDITVYKHGMHADLNETFIVGKTDHQAKKLVQTAHDALHKAIAICKPGTFYRDIGTVIEDYVQKQGFSVVRRYTGHGIGKLFHTNPNIFHYRANKAKGLMKAGHVFCIEPMINEGSYHEKLWPDEWTAVTADGKRSAQFEHMVLVTETGCEVLTARLPESPALEHEIDSS